MEEKLREILMLNGMCGISTLDKTTKEILLLFGVIKSFCDCIAPTYRDEHEIQRCSYCKEIKNNNLTL